MKEPELHRISISDMDSSKFMAFGSLYILGLDATFFPMETLKTIAMSNKYKSAKNKNLSPGLFSLAYNIVKKEGITRFWKGCLTSTLGNFPGNAFYFIAYESTQEVMNHLITDKESVPLTFLRGFLAGFNAEVCGGIFYVPADIVSQRLQVQNLKGFHHNCRLYRGPFDVLSKILKSDGIHGLYRGYVASVSSYAPLSAVQWGSYETLKRGLFKTVNYLESQDHIPKNIPLKDHVICATSAAVAGILSVIANNPLEVMRVRTQLLESRSKNDRLILNGGYLHLAKTVLRNEGWTAFYKGLSIRLLSIVPSSIASLTGYEVIKSNSL